MSEAIARMLEASRKQFHPKRNNCAHAVAAALSDHAQARRAFMFHRPSSDVLKAARIAARLAECAPAGDGPAWGVCDAPEGRALCARIDGHWWRRGSHGIASVKPDSVIEAWAA